MGTKGFCLAVSMETDVGNILLEPVLVKGCTAIAKTNWPASS